jgi:hypothetical protein
MSTYKFQPNIEAKVKFLFGDAIQYQGNYGPRLRVNCEVNGNRSAVYFDGKLLQIISGLPVGQGCVLAICKRTEWYAAANKNLTTWDVRLEQPGNPVGIQVQDENRQPIHQIGQATAGFPQQPAPVQPAAAAIAVGAGDHPPAPAAAVTYESIVDLLERCLETTRKITDDPEMQRTIVGLLFIDANRRGFHSPAVVTIPDSPEPSAADRAIAYIQAQTAIDGALKALAPIRSLPERQAEVAEAALRKAAALGGPSSAHHVAAAMETVQDLLTPEVRQSILSILTPAPHEPETTADEIPW